MAKDRLREMIAKRQYSELLKKLQRPYCETGNMNEVFYTRHFPSSLCVIGALVPVHKEYINLILEFTRQELQGARKPTFVDLTDGLKLRIIRRVDAPIANDDYHRAAQYAMEIGKWLQKNFELPYAVFMLPTVPILLDSLNVKYK
jgi:hypothetical protein